MLGEVVIDWPTPVEPARDWETLAACRGAVEMPFVADGERIDQAAERLRPFATNYCRSCPVRSDCRAQLDEYGTWGGELRNGNGVVRDLLTPPPIPGQRKKR